MDNAVTDRFTKMDPINKGWSDDKKYYEKTADGKKRFLRISDISAHEEKEQVGLSTPICTI
ncbi:MAG: hypothetical protein E6312_05390 [Peptoniphilus grossensis]|uniref:hypothetical protein n=1 Tax=Peptoniphilus grossensis TaxID=1465756 RepID=UPI00290D3FE8|nr:hypothetical protein [Peptoniphilus grossensis]MDU7151488.1 hypothetical protein [Peptoniphilus grossensis]